MANPNDIWAMRQPMVPLGENQNYQGMSKWGMPAENSLFQPQDLGAPGLMDLNDPSQWGLNYTLSQGGLDMNAPGTPGTNISLGDFKWGEGINAAANLFGAWNGYQKNKLAENQMELTQSNFREQFDYAKELTEERRNRHNALRAKYV